MKRQIYVIAFGVLGALLAFLSSALIVLVAAKRGQLFELNPFINFFVIMAGAMLGISEGNYWWKVIYIDKAYLDWKKAKFSHKNKWHGFSLALVVIVTATIAVLV